MPRRESSSAARTAKVQFIGTLVLTVMLRASTTDDGGMLQSMSPTMSRDGRRAERDASDVRVDRFPLAPRELAFIAAFWLLLAIITEVNRAFDPRGPGPQLTAFGIPIAVSIIKSAAWALLTPPLFLLAGRVVGVGRQADRMMRIVVLVIAGILAAVLVNLTMNATFSALASQIPGRQRPPIWRVWGYGFVNDLIIGTGVIAAGLARAFSLHYRARHEQAVRLQAQLAEARLDAMRRQLDPHFLFNTLHAISSLVERDPRGVRRMISRLSELLRHSLEGAGEQEVSLREELALLARYIEIMQVRFQGRLEVRTQVDDRALDAAVPNLILQPLVENAIKHGVEKLTGRGEISIEVSVEGDELVLRVRDNGPGPAPESVSPVTASGVGLSNTVARLKQLYGLTQRFTLSRDGDGRTLAEVRIPFRSLVELRTAAVSVPEGEAAHRLRSGQANA